MPGSFTRGAGRLGSTSSCPLHSSGTRSLEDVCLQVTDLLPGLRKLRNLLPEHGCLLLSPGNFWQNDRERFHADPDIIRTIHQHEPKTLQTSATLKGAGAVPREPLGACQSPRPLQRLLQQICGYPEFLRVG